MRRSPLHVLWLLAVWLALWGTLSVANVVSGLVVALLVVRFLCPAAPAGTGRVRPVATARLLAYFAVKLVEANVIVAWEVLTPRNRIVEGIVAVPLRTSSDVLLTVIADAITLTPGTLTVHVHREPAVVYVHVLHLEAAEKVRAEVQHLEDLVLAAFGPSDPGEPVGLERSQATDLALDLDEEDRWTP